MKKFKEYLENVYNENMQEPILHVSSYIEKALFELEYLG